MTTDQRAIANLLDAVEGVLAFTWDDNNIDAAEAIDRLRTANDELGVVQRLASPQAPLSSKQLLIDCRTALNDWVAAYASEFCDNKTVDEAHSRIANGGGTLAYIGKLVERLGAEIGKPAVETTGESSAQMVLRDCDEYLSHNGLNYIGSGSILHKAIKNARSAGKTSDPYVCRHDDPSWCDERCEQWRKSLKKNSGRNAEQCAKGDHAWVGTGDDLIVCDDCGTDKTEPDLRFCSHDGYSGPTSKCPMCSPVNGNGDRNV